MSEKSYGQIDFEERDKILVKLGLPPANWERLAKRLQAISEAGAQAVIAEFCERHNIHLHVGGKPEDAAARLLQWVGRNGDVTEIHITIPETENPDQADQS